MKFLTWAIVIRHLAAYFPELTERLVMDALMCELLENDEIKNQLINNIERRLNVKS